MIFLRQQEAEYFFTSFMCAPSFWLPFLMKSSLNRKGIRPLLSENYVLFTCQHIMYDAHWFILSALCLFPSRPRLAVDGGWYYLSNHNKNVLVKQFWVSTVILTRHNPPFAPAKRFKESIIHYCKWIWLFFANRAFSGTCNLQECIKCENCYIHVIHYLKLNIIGQLRTTNNQRFFETLIFPSSTAECVLICRTSFDHPCFQSSKILGFGRVLCSLVGKRAIRLPRQCTVKIWENTKKDVKFKPCGGFLLYAQHNASFCNLALSFLCALSWFCFLSRGNYCVIEDLTCHYC